MDVFEYCEHCGSAIAYGHPYISITRSVEVAERSLVSGNDEADVLECSAILTLCKKCGSRYNEQFFVALVNVIPYDRARVCEN